MHKENLIKKLAKKNRRTRQFYRDALNEIIDGIQSQLAEGKTVTLMGFGTFYTRMHKGGKGRNFKTKKPMEYKAVRLATFRPGNTLKQAVRRKKGIFRR
jgi:nucleoid DNA-binding protein